VILRSAMLMILSIGLLLPADNASTATPTLPLTIGGFDFLDGERAFADDAFLVSGSGVRFSCLVGGTAASSIAEALSGSEITQCVNVVGGGDG